MVLTNVKSCKNIEYICVLLEDYMPELTIEGVDFKSDASISRVEKRMGKIIQDKEELLDILNDQQKQYATSLLEKSFLNDEQKLCLESQSVSKLEKTNE